ncbi:hypothetical protein [Calidithermus timidus]|uniref:hypothetical protein n=1 Tax=Calidithermus timidus TaxID=307124 RepID=UPI000365226C|nr:hypothetical protein [Calidithermus timidus]
MDAPRWATAHPGAPRCRLQEDYFDPEAMGAPQPLLVQAAGERCYWAALEAEFN